MDYVLATEGTLSYNTITMMLARQFYPTFLPFLLQKKHNKTSCSIPTQRNILFCLDRYDMNIIGRYSIFQPCDY